MFEKWNAQLGKFVDVRYESYDELKYPNREYLKSNCKGCPSDCGVGYDHDSLTCRRCSGFDD